MQPESRACPKCWHANISSYWIEDYLISGGVLNNVGTCNKCQYNVHVINQCSHCNLDQPCPKCYATVYNGQYNKYMSEEMHKIYMRNSPYHSYWSERPRSIGEWYGNQPTSLYEAIIIAQKFTKNTQIQKEWKCMLNTFVYLSERTKVSFFWSKCDGFTGIYKRNFSSDSLLSQAMFYYFSTITKRFQ